MSEKLTEKAHAALEISVNEAERSGQSKVASEHILYGLISVKGSAALIILHELGVRIGVLRTRLENLMRRPVANEITLREIGWTTKARLVRREAIRRAVSSGASETGTHHLLLGLLSVGNCQASSILREKGVFLKAAEEVAAELPPHIESGGAGEQQKNTQEMPGIDYFCRDLTKLAREGKLDPVIGRERQINRLMQVLCRRKKSNPILIGEPGVGKTAIVEGLAGLIAQGKTPNLLAGKRILALDMAAVVAGTKYRGQFEQRLKKLLSEVAESGDIILFIDEAHVLVGAGAAEGAMDAANLLKPALARGELQCIGATTLDEYRKKIEKDGALERRFQPVPVDPPCVSETIEILEGLRRRYEEHHGTTYTDEAVQAAARLAARYISGRFLPDKAIDVMDEAGAKNRVAHCTLPDHIKEMMNHLADLRKRKKEASQDEDFEGILSLREEIEEKEEQLADERATWLSHVHITPVSEEQVAEVVADMTGIPVSRVGKSETARLLDLEDRLEARIVGQKEAISSITSAIRRSRVGLRDVHKPAGTFLFLGPSGVGKTETARILAELVFGDPSALIRIDMSEFQQSFAGSRLIGAPPGYIGYDEGGKLTEKVRRRPYSVVLLDEIEKAHTDLYNMLLQVMDYGRMTDNYGREIDFTNTIMIMTSNIASRDLLSGGRLGFAREDKETEADRIGGMVMDAVRNQFNPEFLNRLDEIVIFNPLEFSDMERIVSLQMDDVEERLTELNISLALSPEAITLIAEAGYDPEAGARHIRRTIRRLLEDPLTDSILRSEFASGDTVLAVRDGNRIVFRVAEESIHSKVESDTIKGRVEN
ncbi:MAG: ATP-dependent Clp protease ATP-binding subunit [Candidatus Fermentibacteraceae bacterium]|nr:ATP-dependent Clp protease ATP-binding subunit [Candidatus Fermentibacteraceae bacterium]